jgi:hypothetical protein
MVLEQLVGMEVELVDQVVVLTGVVAVEDMEMEVLEVMVDGESVV